MPIGVLANYADVGGSTTEEHLRVYPYPRKLAIYRVPQKIWETLIKLALDLALGFRAKARRKELVIILSHPLAKETREGVTEAQPDAIDLICLFQHPLSIRAWQRKRNLDHERVVAM